MRGRDALVLAQHRHHGPELTAPCLSTAFPLLLGTGTYASRAERVWVSGGVNKHHTTVICTVPPRSPAFITPAFPAAHNGQHFTLQPRARNSRCRHPQLPRRDLRRPAHAANEHHCTRVTPRASLSLSLWVRPPPPPPPPRRTMSPNTYWHPRACAAVHHSPAHAHCSHSGSAPLNQHGTDKAAVKTRTRALSP